jgi:integrating conjugative element protein (TIGR03749 family)
MKKTSIISFRPTAPLLVIFASLATITSAWAQALQETVEHVVWTNAPIRVMLPVGVERRIDFPVPVKLEWPDAVRDQTSNLQIRENGSVYWTAKAPFERQRVNVLTDSGYSYLLDVEAKEGASDHPLIVIDDRIESDEGSTTEPSADTASRFYQYDYIDLTRYAAKNLFAPPRLAQPLPGVVRVPIETDVDYPLYKGGDLITRPIAQWKAATLPTLYVTAVHVASNNTSANTPLDPRHLRGELLAATPQHDFVMPKGRSGDTTVWFLVTARPFEEVAP